MPNAKDMETHEDPYLAAAYAAENEGVRLDREAFGVAWLFAIVPGSLVLLLLSAALGDAVWKALPVLFVGGIVVLMLVNSGLVRRYRSDLPMELPGHGTVAGPAKRRLVAKAIALLVGLTLLYVAEQAGAFARLRDWLMGWRSRFRPCLPRQLRGLNLLEPLDPQRRPGVEELAGDDRHNQGNVHALALREGEPQHHRDGQRHQPRAGANAE